jgi:hypothetical protein
MVVNMGEVLLLLRSHMVARVWGTIGLGDQSGSCWGMGIAVMLVSISPDWSRLSVSASAPLRSSMVDVLGLA